MDKKRIIVVTFLFLMLIAGFNIFAQDQVNLDLKGDINFRVKKRIIKNAEALINMLNISYRDQTSLLNYNNIDISDEAIIVVNELWANSHFSFPQLDISTTVLIRSDKQYEVRNIPIYIEKADPEEKSQNIVILFDENGGINDLFISIGYKNFKSIMPEGKGVKDLRRREILLDFIENFRTAYNRKDIEFIGDVFSEDALIIVGKVVKTNKVNPEFKHSLNNEQVIYVRRTKEEYINKLNSAFNRNQFINIKFNNIKVVEHRRLPHLYGVTIQQDWNTSTYNDKGYVFLLIDLRDLDNPMIHVRTWDTKDTFNIGSFNLSED